MAYVSDWMSVKDALSYIRQVTGCGVGSALAHLQQASRDGNVSGRERGQRARSERAWYEQVGLDRLEAAWQNFVDQELPTEDQAAFSSETLTALVDGFQEGFEVLRENVTSAWPRREAVPEPTQEIPSTSGQAAEAILSVPITIPTKRRHNGTNFSATDAPLVSEMWQLITDDKARSAEDAARAVVKRAKGAGEPDSKVKRLAKRYRQAYPAQS